MTLTNSNYHFSYYENLFSSKAPQGKLDINELIEFIKYGYINETIGLLRAAKSKESYNKIKASNIPAVTLSGIFNERNNKGLQEHSGLMQIDIDHLENYSEIFNKLISDEYTYVAFKSPGGAGIKVVVKINPSESTHLEQFYALQQHYKEEYDIEIDPACKDIARCMLLSYDPDIFCNPFSSVFAECLSVKKEIQREQHYTTHLNLIETDKVSLVEQIVEQAERNKIDLTEGYENWIKIGYAISGELGDGGRDYFHRLSKLNQNYSQEKSDRQYTNLNNKNNRSISLGTLIYLAKQNNIEIHFPKATDTYSKESPIICSPENDAEKRFLLGQKGTKEFLAIALNPSTANEVRLDPTSRNIKTLAHNSGCDGWYLVNLYPGRTSKPEFLPKDPDINLIEENIGFIKELLSSKKNNITKVLLCWGNEVDSFTYLKESSKTIIAILEECNLPCYYMKLTGNKNPYHPSPTPVNRWLGGINNVTLKQFQ